MVGSFCYKMHASGTSSLCIFSGLSNIVYIGMSLSNVYTADLHQDVHLIPLSRDMLMSAEFPTHFSCQTLSVVINLGPWG